MEFVINVAWFDMADPDLEICIDCDECDFCGTLDLAVHYAHEMMGKREYLNDIIIWRRYHQTLMKEVYHEIVEFF